MAKKDEAAGENPAAEGEAAEGVAKKGLVAKLLNKKMLMIAVPALLVVLGGGGAGAYFFLFQGHDDKAQAAKAEEAPLTPPQVAFSDVDGLLVNVQTADATPAYLKLSVSLELDNDVEKTGIQALMPRVKDEFQAYLRELRVDDLKGSEGVLRLKEELLRRVNVAAAPYKVRDVLLKEMIVQ